MENSISSREWRASIPRQNRIVLLVDIQRTAAEDACSIVTVRKINYSWYITVRFSVVRCIIDETSVKVFLGLNESPFSSELLCTAGLLFHSFPVDQHRFDLWRQTVLKHCSRTLSINKHSKICHRHFRPDDYIANHTGLTRYLKATALPSIFTDIQSDAAMLHSSVFHTYSADGHPNRSIHLTGLPETSSSSPILLPVEIIVTSPLTHHYQYED